MILNEAVFKVSRFAIFASVLSQISLFDWVLLLFISVQLRPFDERILHTTATNVVVRSLFSKLPVICVNALVG